MNRHIDATRSVYPGDVNSSAVANGAPRPGYPSGSTSSQFSKRQSNRGRTLDSEIVGKIDHERRKRALGEGPARLRREHNRRLPLGVLTDAQRQCVELKRAGLPYSEIKRRIGGTTSNAAKLYERAEARMARAVYEANRLALAIVVSVRDLAGDNRRAAIQHRVEVAREVLTQILNGKGKELENEN